MLSPYRALLSPLYSHSPSFCSDEPVDHDDGSAWYEDAYNFYMYGGTKNYLGHSKRNIGQLFVYSDLHPGYGFPGCQVDFTDDNYGSMWSYSKCILRGEEVPYDIQYCNPKNMSQVPPHVENVIYTPSGHAVFQCGKSNFTLAEWQALGMDNGTTEAMTPAVETIVGWGRALLYLNTSQGEFDTPSPSW
jgi:hypothetical protein